MTTPANRLKLGLFVVGGLAVAFALLLWMGAHQLGREVRTRVMFFDEPVTGLDVGSPVKFRGVTVGTVTAIAIAPDHRAIQVTAQAYVEALRELGLTVADGQPLPESDDLRAQLASTGITGTKFIQVDFFDPELNPTLQFDFPLPPDTLSTVKSGLKSVEDSILLATDQLPRLLAAARSLVEHLDQLSAGLDIKGLENQVGELVETVRSTVAGVDAEQLSTSVLDAVDRFDKALAAVDRLASSIDSGQGPLRSLVDELETLARTVDSTVKDLDAAATAAVLRQAGKDVSGLAREGQGLTRETAALMEQLRTDADLLRQTLQAVTALAELLERDPGVLLRGRESPSAPPPRSP